MTTHQSVFEQTEDEAKEHVERLMKNYNLDEDTAVRVQDLMKLKGIDEDSAVEQINEQNN